MSKSVCIFEKNVKFMYEHLDNFGKDCAFDGKLLDSYTKNDNKNSTSSEIEKRLLQGE